MRPGTRESKLRCRTIVISDVHLGFKGCRAGDLLEFLNSVDCEQLYLILRLIHWTEYALAFKAQHPEAAARLDRAA